MSSNNHSFPSINVTHSNHKTYWSEKVISRPFVDRLGGNPVFTLDLNDPSFNKKLPNTPDAGPSFTWKESFDLRGFADVELWKQSILEGWATSLITWLSGLVVYSLVPTISDFTSGALFPALLGSLVNTISLSLFISAAGPVSGGHLNPLITISTFFGRLSTFPRTILYILCQITGATVASFLIRAALGRPGGPDGVISGCWIDPSVVTAGEAVILETMTCLSVIFLAFGIGLDPRQKAVFGPALGPFLIGLAVGLCTFVSGTVKPGYTGASVNPARCFGLMAAEGRWDLHWVHWVGAIVAGALNGMLYWVIPPNKPWKT